MRTRAATVLLPLLLAVPTWAGPATTRVRVLFTSDTHAHVLPYDQVQQKMGRGSIAQAATVIARLRREVPATVVLDGGDSIQGTALAHYALAAPGADGVDPTVAAMNLVGYDAATPGNHEFNYGLKVLASSIGQARFPWLAANLRGTERVGLRVGSSLVLVRGGVRIGVLGLTNPNVPGWDLPSRWAGLEFLDPVAEARTRVAELKKRSDLVVVVAHTGFERDLATGEPDNSDFENYAWRLAELPGVDVLLTGHEHHNIAPRRLGNAIVAQPGRYGELVTRIDLELLKRRGRFEIASFDGANVPTQGEAADPAIVAATEPLRARVEAELDRPMGELSAPLRVGGVPTADESGADLVHAVQLEATGAELSLAAPLLSWSLELPAGKVNRRLAHALCPYPNTLLVVRLKGPELKDVLEHAARGWASVRCADPGGCTLLREPSVPYYNFDTLGGIATYLVDPTAAFGQRVRGLRVAGRPLGKDEQVTVAISSYRAAGGGRYPHLSAANAEKEVDTPIVDLFISYFERHGVVTPETDHSWAFTLPLREAVAPAAGHAAR